MGYRPSAHSQEAGDKATAVHFPATWLATELSQPGMVPVELESLLGIWGELAAVTANKTRFTNPWLLHLKLLWNFFFCLSLL